MPERIHGHNVDVAPQGLEQIRVVWNNTASIVGLGAELESDVRFFRSLAMWNEGSGHRHETTAVVERRLVTPSHWVAFGALVISHASWAALLVNHLGCDQLEELRIFSLVWNLSGAIPVDFLWGANFVAQGENRVCVWKTSLLKLDYQNDADAVAKHHFVPDDSNEMVDFSPKKSTHFGGVE